MIIRPFHLLALTLPLASACACNANKESANAAPPSPAAVESAEPTQKPMRTTVTDLDAFFAYIKQHPSPEALRAKYPGLFIVMPGDITTRELRGDNSRFFAKLDDDGRIIGGKFQ